MATEAQKQKDKESKTSLKIYSRDYDTIIENPEDTFNPEKILFPFAVEDQLHCFVCPLMAKEETKKAMSFFPSTRKHELIMKEDMNIVRFQSNTQFRNDQKVGSKKLNFTHWIERLEPTRGAQ
ncbi:hypothetical protein PIB30_058348 [Stylosanthes scabra]|uniref:Uncharacterized protein n=1 Tax=Stylosanthes scabra TaxID=79078 RepID=A0ABU6QKD1_9FABA|nr:hypothetical protein [Stylosanthes scabra]